MCGSQNIRPHIMRNGSRRPLKTAGTGNAGFYFSRGRESMMHDALLPKRISGKLRVTVADQIAENA